MQIARTPRTYVVLGRKQRRQWVPPTSGIRTTRIITPAVMHYGRIY